MLNPQMFFRIEFIHGQHQLLGVTAVKNSFLC